jgi:hypothetical protein
MCAVKDEEHEGKDGWMNVAIEGILPRTHYDHDKWYYRWLLYA